MRRACHGTLAQVDTCACVCKASTRYTLSPATENWARHVREADRAQPALAIGFVGATSAGKSWLVSKLQSEGAAQPARFEQSFAGGVDLQSMTSDINLYLDPVDQIYYVDFEGTYGTLPLQYYAADMAKVVQRCADVASWEGKRRQALKESFQPAVAYLMCDVPALVSQLKRNYDDPLQAAAQWAEYFRSIDCFCLPDEYTFCKRSGFDGEEVCKAFA
ncbi:unnamed protein product [Symbiodinium sp. KB8]|nr:unnamed protein product [Symbiodinium sp. KB8]